MRIRRVLVRGPSMVPTLRDGDHLVVRRGASIASGDLVVARFRSQPDLLVVKRAIEESDGGWVVHSDNPYAPSLTGVGDVEAKVVLRYWPLTRWRVLGRTRLSR